MFHSDHSFGKDLKDLFRRLNVRYLILILVACGCAGGLIYRLFMLQIVNGETYLNNFQLRIKREVSIDGTRGNIYDRNGNILAYNELAYAVTIRDNGAGDAGLNATIEKALDIIEKNGDTVSAGSFDIALDDSGAFAFTVDGSARRRFLADVYGHASTDDLTYDEESSTADDVIYALCGRYEIGDTVTESDGTKTFVPERGYDDKKRILQLVTIRYALSLNNYQQYLSTTIANDVSDETVAAILENKDSMDGIDIEDTTVRRYVDSKYFAQILGYTGTISTEELRTYSQTDSSYTSTDVVGKSGIEKSMESTLRGTKGSKTVYVDNLGKELETVNITQPTAGNDVYLTIDKDLQEAAYDILERKLADIILTKIQPIREYTATEDSSADEVVIPIYSVYYQMIGNNILDTSQFSSDDASDTEKSVYRTYTQTKSDVLAWVQKELESGDTAYTDLLEEDQAYESCIVQLLKDRSILDMSQVDTSDETYTAWTTDETISLKEFLQYCITKNWIQADQLGIGSAYATSDEEYSALVTKILDLCGSSADFDKQLYHYMILNDTVTGAQICQLLIDQGVVSVGAAEEAALQDGTESAYQFMTNRISNLDLTPAQLAVEPCTGSMVITDPTSGDVLALVSYPGYDNNRMANGVDADYYEQLRNDQSNPLFNYATQQKTAPGSTFKMVSATAGLSEGVIDTSTEIYCSGVFTTLGTSDQPRCWIYPAGHGSLTVSQAITHSCNVFFYNVGYRLASEGSGNYDSAAGIEKLSAYASLYGLGDKTGIEIEEAQSNLSTEDAIRTAIGQGSNNITTVALARYVSTVANSGTCYNLTLIDKIEDSNGSLIEDNSASIRNVISMDASYWDAIHEGMKGVVEAKTYFDELPVTVAGKTGTAQQSNAHPNHAHFVCYAPYDSPRIAIATRVANGYTSDYAAQITENVLAYYFNVKTLDEIVGTSAGMDASSITGD